MLRALGLKRKERPAEKSGGLDSTIPLNSFFGSVKRKPTSPNYLKTSNLISQISSPIQTICKPAFVDSLPPRPASTIPSSRTQPLIPRRTTSTLRKPQSSKPSPLYNLKSFSTTQLNSLTSRFTSGSTTTLPLSDDVLHFPSPPPRRPHRPDSGIFSSSYSLFPVSAPQLAALDFDEPFTFSLLPNLKEEVLESEVEEKGAVESEVQVMETSVSEETINLSIVKSEEEETRSVVTVEPEEDTPELDLDRRSSNFTPAPPRITKRHTLGLEIELGEAVHTWKRASIALSVSSLFTTDDFGTPLSTPRLSGFGSGSSSSGSDEMECSTPKSELAELPLSPEYLPVDGKRRASLAFPSRMGASCISLGRY